MVTIGRKGLDQFEGQYKGSTGWFKLDSGFLQKNILQVIHNSIKNVLKYYWRSRHGTVYNVYCTVWWIIYQEKFWKTPNMISESEAPAPEKIKVQKHRRYTASYTSSL